jgi:hypothetical protein
MARVVATVVVVVTVATTSTADARRPARARPPVNVYSAVDPVDEARAVHDYAVALLLAYLDAELVRIVAYVESVIAAERAAEVARRAVPPVPARGSSNGASGDCYAGPIPAYIVTRESGGDPNAVNRSSGAFGCFQFLPSTWASSCSDLARDVAGQIACADRISNGGTNLAPWAATR